MFLNGTQTVTGDKTFSASPILPTPTAGDNSTKGATTAYVDGALAGKADASALAAKANLAGATFTGPVITPASDVGGAGFNIGNSIAAPSSPVDGDLWFGGGALITRQNGTTYTMVNIGNTQTVTGNKTFSGTSNAVSGKLTFNASDTTRHRLNVAPSSSVPAAPTDGDVWSTSTGFFGRVSGGTRNMSIHVGTTAPSSPATNDLWVDTT